MPPTVLLLTTDGSLRRTVSRACEKADAELLIASSLDEARALVDPASIALVFCDHPFFDDVHATWTNASILLFAEPRDSDQAIEAIKKGAFDFLVRPIRTETVVPLIRNALRIRHDVDIPAVFEAEARDDGIDRFVGQSPAMKEVFKLIGLIAPRDINVLITGESGTGKELVARALLQHSPRKENPYVAVNCAAIPETLLESELFGHEKGAFTGADHRRIGKFEQCDTGTLFLDEIGDIPPATQAKLLRVLQEGTFQRLGGNESIHSDVRIIAATHQPLEALIGARRFRQDLYYRLKVASIHLPALREREVDVVLLAHYFVERYNADFGTQVRSFSPETLPLLLRYPWPGNVRELENAIKSALVVARGGVFLPEFLPDELRFAATHASVPNVDDATMAPVDASQDVRQVIRRLMSDPAAAGDVRRRTLDLVDGELIRAALSHTHGRVAPAARLLGMSRTTLRKRMDELGVEVRGV